MSKRKRNRTGAFQQAHFKETLGRFTDRQKAYAFRAGLQKTLLEARTSRQGRSVAQFFDETERLSRVERERAVRQDVGFDFLTQVIEAEELPLHEELRWLAGRMRFFSSELSTHVELSPQIQSAVLQGDFPAALSLIDSHETTLGASLWSVALNLTLIEWLLGPDDLRFFMTEIRRRYPKAILPFFANYAAQRAEPTVSVGWFQENLHSRLLGRSRRDSFIYLEHKLAGTLPETAEDLSTFLRVEQNHHEVDIYESTLQVLQHIATSRTLSSDPQIRESVISLLDGIGHFADFRIAKLRAAFGLSCELSLLRPFEADSLNLALTGNPTGALASARRRLRAGVGDVHDMFCVGALARTRSNSRGRGPLASIWTGKSLATTFQRLGRNASDFDEARKLGLTLSPLPVGAVLLAYANAFSYGSVNELPARLALVSLNSATVGPIDYCLGKAAAESLSPLLSLSDAARPFAIAALGFGNEPGIALLPKAIEVATGIHALLIGSAHEALSAVDSAPSGNTFLDAIATSIQIQALSLLGEIGEAARLLGYENLVRGALLEEDALARTFEDRTWDDISPFAESIGTSLGLMLFADRNKDEKYQSYRRFSLETYLMSRGVDRPSKLGGPAADEDENEFRVFLHSACATSIIDMLSSIESSREVLEERRGICVLLRALDPNRASLYDEEVIAITQELTIREGMQVFDGSRVHVDRSGVRSVARRELAESYQRFRSLESSGGDSGTFSAFIRELMGADLAEKYLLALPESEADLVLVSMAQKLRDIFLFNVPSGLDSFLSKRVRHGSIVGHLRGPAEAEGLLLQRSSAGKYSPNSKTLSFPTKHPEAVMSALSDFSRAFDDHLLRLKDVLLHVRSEGFQLGVFDSPVNVGTFRTFKGIANDAPDAESFLDGAIAALWTYLGPSLESARNLLERETKPFLVERLNILKSQLLDLAASGAERASIEAAIGRAATGVQSKIDAAKSWFQPQDSFERSYTLNEAISIGLRAVKAVRADFEPTLHTEIDRDRQITSAELPTFLDILYAALGNVADHSHLAQPSVWIRIFGNSQNGCVRVEIENEVLDDGQLEQIQRELSETLQKIDAEVENEKVRSEGKSGIRKIASIAARSQGGVFSASARPGIRFEVAVDMAVSCVRQELALP